MAVYVVAIYNDSWAEHFEQLLNRAHHLIPQTLTQLNPTFPTLAINQLDASVEILYHYARIYGKRNTFQKTARNDIL